MKLEHFRMILAVLLVLFYCGVAATLLLYPLLSGMPVGTKEFVTVYKTYFGMFAASSVPGILSSILTYYFTAKARRRSPKRDQDGKRDEDEKRNQEEN